MTPPPDVDIELQPEGRHIRAHPGETLKAALERAGVLFPDNCGGRGECLSCRVEFLSEPPPMKVRERALLPKGSRFRMACLTRSKSPCRISIPIFGELEGSKELNRFQLPGGGSGFAAAVDLGTTLIALYVIDLARGSIIAQGALLNPQIPFGGDVMTRLGAARDPAHLERLATAVRSGVAVKLRLMLERAGIAPGEVVRVGVAGNSAMTQLYLGMKGEGLERHPFRGPLEGKRHIDFPAAYLNLPDSCECRTLPVVGGFVGGDITAAVLAAGLHRDDAPRLLIDLGTNGEIVLAAGGMLWAASTAAGPAFEGVGMTFGMPAAPGAVEGFTPEGNPIVIGGGEPLGFCGSGYIAALAWMLQRGDMTPAGLIRPDDAGERRWSLPGRQNTHPFLLQEDVRCFQLAKGAVAAGIHILLDRARLGSEDISELILTGSFGNRVDAAAAMSIGLIPELLPERVTYMDNAAGRGVALSLADETARTAAESLPARIQPVNLAECPEFETSFAVNMLFPGASL